jgi:hypothetical protein
MIFWMKVLLGKNHFEKKVSEINWDDYNAKRVMIKGCSSVPVPTWAYLILTARLAQVADDILYGEPCATIKIYNRNKA